MLSDNGEAAPDGQREWFAAYTMSRHEKRIASHCERIGIEQFLPLYTWQRSWKNRTRVDLQMPLFPNYIFVRLLPQDQGPLMRLPGLLNIVGNTAGPVVIPDGDMELLRRIIACKSIEPYPLLTKGDKVRVTKGPLAGVIGIVLKKGNGLRFIVTLDVIGKSVSLQIDGSALERIALHASLLADQQNAVARSGKTLPSGETLRCRCFLYLTVDRDKVRAGFSRSSWTLPASPCANSSPSNCVSSAR